MSENSCFRNRKIATMRLAIFLSLLLAFATADKTTFPVNYYGVDVSQGYSQAAYRCLVGENLLFAGTYSCLCFFFLRVLFEADCRSD